MDRQVQHQIHLLAEAFANDAALAFLQGTVHGVHLFVTKA